MRGGALSIYDYGDGAGVSEGRGLGRVRVFYYPLDFALAVRAYLRALRPKMLVLMESELWPGCWLECGRAGVPVAVVNARVAIGASRACGCGGLGAGAAAGGSCFWRRARRTRGGWWRWGRGGARCGRLGI